MKNRNLSLPGMVWIFSLFLAWHPFSVKARETESFFRHAVILTRGSISGASARIFRLHHAITVHAQSANGWPIGIRKEVVLALPHGSGKTEALIDANGSKCLGDGSETITSAANLQINFASHHSGASKTIPHSHSISNTISAPIYFQLADGLIYMQASLNGSQPLWMMLDTGSSVTVFDEPVSKTLGIRFLGEGDAYGPGQGSAQRLAFANHATLSFAGAELSDQTVATLPLEWFSREVGRSTDGFLGSNMFRNYVVEIDYANQVLHLYDPAAYSYSGSGQRLPLQFIWNNIPSVQGEVVTQDGTAITGIFLIDSGATTAIWLTRTFSEAHPEFLSAQETIEVPNVIAVGGELSTRLGRVPAFRLGGFLISMPLTQFSQNTSGIWATPDLAGIIGAQMLRRFKVIFDYRRGEMILEPNEHFGDSSE
jgi:Aspartyl protease